MNISSMAGLVGTPEIPAYVASKHGVIGLSKAVSRRASEWIQHSLTTSFGKDGMHYGKHGIRINAVCPG